MLFVKTPVPLIMISSLSKPFELKEGTLVVRRQPEVVVDADLVSGKTLPGRRQGCLAATEDVGHITRNKVCWTFCARPTEGHTSESTGYG